jgi:hypothetical protein
MKTKGVKFLHPKGVKFLHPSLWDKEKKRAPFQIFSKFKKADYKSRREFTKSIPNLFADTPFFYSLLGGEKEIENQIKRAESFLKKIYSQGFNEKDLIKYGNEMQPYASGKLYKEYGGCQDPLYLPVEPGYNKLITYPMYCVLIGLLLSDGSINKAGRYVINLSNRWKSGVEFSLFLINLLAPIIQSVDLHDGRLDEKYTIDINIFCLTRRFFK